MFLKTPQVLHVLFSNHNPLDLVEPLLRIVACLILFLRGSRLRAGFGTFELTIGMSGLVLKKIILNLALRLPCLAV